MVLAGDAVRDEGRTAPRVHKDALGPVPLVFGCEAGDIDGRIGRGSDAVDLIVRVGRWSERDDGGQEQEGERGCAHGRIGERGARRGVDWRVGMTPGGRYCLRAANEVVS